MNVEMMFPGPMGMGIPQIQAIMPAPGMMPGLGMGGPMGGMGGPMGGMGGPMGGMGMGGPMGGMGGMGGNW
jgi:hypothetical protein